MQKGPILNDNKRNFTSRDSLGIENVAASISADLLPIVNTVTPRAFYWPFMVWIYYDFYENYCKKYNVKDRRITFFDETFLKKQDYFFVLSQLLQEYADEMNLVGKENSSRDIEKNKEGPYPFNLKYFKPRYGGMQYYNAGCLTMDYIRRTQDIKSTNIPKITEKGIDLAIKFESVIKDTEYYKNYRLEDKPVPKEVLIEYGKTINIGLKGFEECKLDLREKLFETSRESKMLALNAEFVKHMFLNNNIEMTTKSYRYLLFDYYSSRGNNNSFPEELKEVVHGWEIVIGRQYFTAGLESIWKYMLEELTTPMRLEEWFNACINNSNWNFSLDEKVKNILDGTHIDYDEREEMIYNATHSNNRESMMENGLRIVFSIYNRLSNRTDFGEEKNYLSWGNQNRSISFYELFDVIDKYKEKPIEELLYFIMKEWLVEQHYITALEKAMRKEDGFYYEVIDGYYKRKNEFTMFFQGIRLIQLTQVIKDLDML